MTEPDSLPLHDPCNPGGPPPPLMAVFGLRRVRTLAVSPAAHPTDTAMVASMARQAATLAARRAGLAETFIAAHVLGQCPPGSSPTWRMSYWPLTLTVPRGVAIDAVAFTAPAQADAATFAAITTGLVGMTLRRGDSPTPLARLDPAPNTDAALSVYCRPGRTWVSQTPVVLPGFDDRNQAKAQALMLKTLSQTSLTPAAVELSRQPYQPGTQPASRYRVPGHIQRFPRYHVRLTWTTPVRGPIALGAGRHIGLGLLTTTERLS